MPGTGAPDGVGDARAACKGRATRSVVGREGSEGQRGMRACQISHPPRRPLSLLQTESRPDCGHRGGLRVFGGRAGSKPPASHPPGPPHGVGLSPSPTADPGVVVGLCLNVRDRVAAEAGWGQAGPPARSRPQAHRWPAGRTTPPHVVTQVEWGHTAPSLEGALAWLPTPPQANAHSHTLTLTHSAQEGWKQP